MKDYYAILGVTKQATDSEIKKAYRKLASQHHPDRGGDANTFKEVQEAYDTLGDSTKRAQYDRPQGFFTRNGNFDDIVDRYFTQFNMRDQMRNTRVSIWIPLESAVVGGTQLISFNTPGGQRPVEISIPPGIHDDENVRYPGLGPGSSDIVVNFRIHGHPVWQRDGLDLLRELELDFWQLIMGTEITFRSITNKDLKLKIPPRTNPGAMLRLKGQGISRQGHNTGDVFVKVKAVMPKNIPDELVEVLTKHIVNK